MELADRIASSGNPLTARVIVNRIWHHLFGTGLVRTVDDFGHVGELPSHSELLDHLSTRFVAEGWSMKKLIRSLVLTRTFQLSNQPSAESREVDPQNRLLQHFPARRLEAEAIRDSILAASGRLDRTLYGPSVQPFRDKDYADRRLFAGPLDGHGRRSIYIKNNLMEGPKFLEAFNFPGGKVTQGRRDVTNVPAQALRCSTIRSCCNRPTSGPSSWSPAPTIRSVRGLTSCFRRLSTVRQLMTNASGSSGPCSNSRSFTKSHRAVC